MSTFSIGRKVFSFASLIIGIVLTIWGLGVAIAKGGPLYSSRGALMVIGVLLFILGLYLFPTLTHHRAIVNIIFLFPLLFAFAVTVIIPLVLGIGYSFTDWNGIKMKGVVGFANYIRMFKQPSFLWSKRHSCWHFCVLPRSRAWASSELPTSSPTLSEESYLVISGSSSSAML